MDSLEWSKKYEVLSISRLYLRSLGFTNEGINSLTDEDLQAIADTLQENLLHAVGMDFNEEVRFLVSCEILNKLGDTDDRTGGQDEPTT